MLPGLTDQGARFFATSGKLEDAPENQARQLFPTSEAAGAPEDHGHKPASEIASMREHDSPNLQPSTTETEGLPRDEDAQPALTTCEIESVPKGKETKLALVTSDIKGAQRGKDATPAMTTSEIEGAPGGKRAASAMTTSEIESAPVGKKLRRI